MKFEQTGKGTYKLDACGLVCPHPQIYTKKSMGKMNTGEVLEIVFDNPASKETIESLCVHEGYEIMGRKETGGKYIFRIRKN